MTGVMHRTYEDPYSRSMGAWSNDSRPRSGGYFDNPSELAYSTDDDVTYDLDHLATYTVAPHRGLITVDDALQRLRRMAHTSGIWTKRLRMRIGARDLVVVDGGEPIERFPLRLVGNVIAASPYDGYENVVAFTVSSDQLLGRQGEIHLFQCVGKSASDLVNDIRTAKSGMPLQKRNDDRSIYSRPGRPRTDYGASANSTNTPMSMSPVPSSRHSIPDANSTEKKSADMGMLDKLLGDIEHFVTHLQQAAKDAADINKQGLRTAAPDAREFYDAFQKFKLCFILLARLKQDIRDPNASELVHMLFNPLATVAEASRNQDDSRFALAEQVVSPLLTTTAIDLLNNCLSSKEMELLRSLGPAWMKPRANWTEEIPQFVLRFRDGTVAPKAWLDEVLELPIDPSKNTADSSPVIPVIPAANQNGVSNGTADQSATGAKRSADSLRRQKDFLGELLARRAKAYVVIKRRDASNPKELSVEEEDAVEVIDDTKKWWSVRNVQQQIGFVPSTILRRAS